MTMNKKNKWMINPFHLVEYSPWPITGSIGALALAGGLASWFHGLPLNLLMMGAILISVTMMQWWRDVVRESTFTGFHTKPTTTGLRLGMILFIVSEVCFFFAFFWAFFHSSLAPNIELGSSWPPKGINPISPWSVPLLNTVVLLSSGVSVTYAHHALMDGTSTQVNLALIITISMGIYFSYLQALEYLESSFTLSDSIYGTSFFVATGFHGLHVLIGTTFLLVCMLRSVNSHFSSYHHSGFEMAAWYWHFVDVVWLFLFMMIYWWGG